MIEGSSSLQNIFDEIFFKATPEKSAFHQPNFYVNLNDAKIVYHRGYLGRKNPLFFISILPPPPITYVCRAQQQQHITED